MAAKLARDGDVLTLTLKGLSRADFGAALASAKSIPGRRYNPAEKAWEFPATSRHAERILSTIRPTPTAEVLAWLRAARAERHEELSTRLPADAELRGEWDELYPYQRAAVDFMADHPRCLLADDMGLGKSVQALVTWEEYCARLGIERGPALIVAPNSVKGSWASEVRRWLGLEATVVSGATRERRAAQARQAVAAGQPVIVNWEKLRARKPAGKPVEMTEPWLLEHDWQAVIADECHRAKNRKAQQTLGLWQLQAPVRLALTGTPILNSPDEIWSLLVWLRPEQYGRGGGRIAYWTFYDLYVDYYETQYGRVVTGVRDPDALRFELADKLVRRTKGTVLDLPPITRRYIDVELGPKQRRIYKEAERKLWVELEQEAAAGDEKAAAVLEGELRLLELPNGAARCTRLRQIASTPALLGTPDNSAKLDTAVELIEDAGRQVVVFSAFKGTCELLRTRLAKRKISCELITGDVPPEERTDRVARFQEGEITVIASTLQAGGVGITLTAADTVIFLERDWTPAINEQAEARLHRIGQENAVTVLILQAVDTVDTGKVQPANELKSIIVGSVLQQDSIKETT